MKRALPPGVLREDEELRLVPIGRIRSPVRDLAQAPRQGRDVGTEVRIELLAAFREGLAGLQAGQRLWVTCWLHRAPRDQLKVHPRRDPAAPLRGVFATRSPARPNPLASYLVDLLAIEEGSLHVRGVDAVDGTPVVDLRPHVPRLDG